MKEKKNRKMFSKNKSKSKIIIIENKIRNNKIKQ